MTLVALFGGVVSGCYFDEQLPIDNISGTVVLPEAAAQRTVVVGGEETTFTSVQNIGPVILGVYAGVSQLGDYPYPTTGPAFVPGNPGDTYPYGGTTVGDFRFACVEALQCKVVTGRHETFQDIVDYFASIGQPVTDAFDREITNGSYLRDICYDILEVNTEEELRLTVTADRNGDGELSELDLDFIQRSDGKWEAPFTLWQQEYFDDPETGEGFTIWGWHDTPRNAAQPFATCNPRQGFNQAEYNEQFFAGLFPQDLLNIPDEYIQVGDYVSTNGYQFEDFSDIPELELDFLVEEQ